MPQRLPAGEEGEGVCEMALTVSHRPYHKVLTLAPSTPFHVAVKLPAGWAGREIAVTRKQVDDDANWFDEWRAERSKRKIGNDRFGWSPDGPAPMQERIGLKSKADRELFQKEIEPKLRARARLGSRTERTRAPDGALFFDCALPDNAVLFIELSMP